MASILDGFDWTTPFIADACVQLSLPVRVGPYGLKPNIAGARAAGPRAVFGTHDLDLISSIRAHAQSTGLKPADYEFHMLYGIQKAAQQRLAHDGALVRGLIAYGEYWFPWYMRRLAERPANVWFVAKSLFG